MKDIKILAVDTTGTTLAVAILADDKPAICYQGNTGRTHSEILMPKIIELTEKSNIKINDIDYFVCSNGPGSFTGLRIGISTLKGLSYALSKPMVEVGTLDGLYYNIRNEAEIICPIIDARREEVYGAIYVDNKKVMEDTSISLKELTDKLKEYKLPVMFCGDGSVSYRDKIIEYMGDNAFFSPEDKTYQNGISVGLLGYEKIKRNEISNCHNFKVNYLKPSQPEMKIK